MQKSNFEVEVLVNGKPAKEYYHKGDTFIEGREGTHFSLRLRNNSSSRVLFVPSIDGLSVMDGKNASFDSSGYIVKAHSTVIIDGWRVSNEEVAQFFFAKKEDSYGEQMGRSSNVGIVGCAVFNEAKPVPSNYYRSVAATAWPPLGEPTVTFTGMDLGKEKNFFETKVSSYLPDKRLDWDAGVLTTSNLTSNPGAINTVQALNPQGDIGPSSLKVESALGTGWGEYKESGVVTVEFERQSAPASMFSILYNTRENLEKIGVNLNREAVYVTPQAFPGQYCEVPKNKNN